MILSDWLDANKEVVVSGPGCILTDADWKTLHGNGLLVKRSARGTTADIVVQEASLDVHLARATKLTDSGQDEVIIPEGQNVVICPGEVMIVETEERFRVPYDARGLVAPKGKVTNLGLTIPTTYIDPGFTKPLFLAVANAGPRAVELEAGSPVAKVEMQRLGAPVVAPWEGQTPAWANFNKALFAEGPCDLPPYLAAALEAMRAELTPAAQPVAAAPAVAPADPAVASNVRLLQIWVLMLTAALVVPGVAFSIDRAFGSSFGVGLLGSLGAAAIVGAIGWLWGPLKQMVTGKRQAPRG
jgi:deoxycytidine triphosphate deaminase